MSDTEITPLPSLTTTVLFGIDKPVGEAIEVLKREPSNIPERLRNFITSRYPNAEITTPLYEDILLKMSVQISNVNETILDNWSQQTQSRTALTFSLGQNQRYNIPTSLYLFLSNCIDMAIAEQHLQDKFGDNQAVIEEVLRATSNERLVRPRLIYALTYNLASDITKEDFQAKLRADQAHKNIRSLITTFDEADKCYQGVFYASILTANKDKSESDRLKAVMTVNKAVGQTSKVLSRSAKILEAMNRAHNVSAHSQASAQHLGLAGKIGTLISACVNFIIDPVLWYVRYKERGTKPNRYDLAKWGLSAGTLVLGALVFSAVLGPYGVIGAVIAISSVSLGRTVWDMVATNRRLKKEYRSLLDLKKDIDDSLSDLEGEERQLSEMMTKAELLLMQPPIKSSGEETRKSIEEIKALNEKIKEKTQLINEKSETLSEKNQQYITRRVRYNADIKHQQKRSTALRDSAYLASGVISLVGAILLVPPLTPIGGTLMGIGGLAAATTFFVSLAATSISNWWQSKKEKKQSKAQAETINEEDKPLALNEKQQSISKRYNKLFAYKYHKKRSESLDDVYDQSCPLVSGSISKTKEMREFDAVFKLLDGSDTATQVANTLYKSRELIANNPVYIPSALDDPIIHDRLSRLSSMSPEQIQSLDERVQKALFAKDRPEWVNQVSEKLDKPIPILEEDGQPQETSRLAQVISSSYSS